MRSGRWTALSLWGVLFISNLGRGQVFTQEAHNLGPVVNSKQSDFAPYITVDGKSLYFASDREGGYGGQDIWVSRRTADGQWGAPVNLGPSINTKFNEGPDTMSADGRTMYLTGCGREDSLGKCDLYVAHLAADGNWSPPQNLGPPVNTRYSEANASLSFDGQSLYFASLRPKGLGGWDLYVSHRTDQGWSEPEDLGAPINTPDNEFIAFAFGNQELYFSSDGHGGFGGADIFYSRKMTEGWSDPVNLGPVINTPYNDMYFSVPGSGDLAYLSSNRNDTLGQEDLYVVPMPLVLNRLKIIALVPPVRTALPAPAASRAKPAPEQPLIAQAPAEAAPLTQETIRQAAATQQPLLLKNLLFDFNQAVLRPASGAELDRLVELLRQNPDLSIEIRGHTDSTGSALYNANLSLQRALAVHSYLIRQGIDPRRLMSAGYGETEPVASNETKEGRQENRRVEFRVSHR